MKKKWSNVAGIFKLRKKRFYLSLSIVSILFVMFAPAAFAASSDPWYIKPLTWFLDFLLGILGGIHDPMDHVFYNGCGIVRSTLNICPDHSTYGLYSTDQFRTVIQRGFYLFGALAMFLVTASIVKSGILLSFRNLSSTMKFEVNDALVKVLIASILLGHFFEITGGLFKVNNLLVNTIKNDLNVPGRIVDFNGVVVPSDGRQIGGRIEMNSLADGLSGLTSPVAKSAVSLASRGVAIWWEVFYLQRKIMISLLLILAPIWICCMFYPMLHGITFAAFKELWSQIIAQALHSALFWGYYHLIDNEMGWFQALVAMCLFIPISESIRFIFGATSGTGGKLATVGTLAGAAGIMNMTKAVTSLGRGAVNAARSYNGFPTGGTSVGSGGGMAGMVGSAMGGGSGGHGQSGAAAGAGEFSAGPISSRLRKVRTAGEIGAGLGSAALRMGMSFAGAGLGPLGAQFGGEAGAAIGDKAGYRAGVGSLVTGEAAVKGAKAARTAGAAGVRAFGTAAKNLPVNIADEYKGMDNRDGDKPTRAVRAVGRGINSAVSGAVGQYRADTFNPSPSSQSLSPEEREDQLAEQREQAADNWGTRAEMAFGRGSFEQGASFGRNRHSGRHLSPAKLTQIRDDNGHGSVYTVETNGSSQLAIKDAATGEFKPISNLGRGNASLGKGETIVTAYQIQGQESAVRMVPMKEQVSVPVEDSVPRLDFQNQSYLYKDGEKSAYTGKTVDPNQFIGSRQSSDVDLRRRNFVSNV